MAHAAYKHVKKYIFVFKTYILHNMYICRYGGVFVYGIEKLLRIKYTFIAINYKHIYIIIELDFELILQVCRAR